MDRAKRFTNFFHNFVVMKKSVNFLLEKKQSDLKQLVGLIHENVKSFGMIILYGHKDHNLTILMKACKEYAPEIFKVFPRDTPEEERLFKLLQRAYVESRYNPDFEITKKDLDALLPKVEHLRDIVKKVCTVQINYYSQQKAG